MELGGDDAPGGDDHDDGDGDGDDDEDDDDEEDEEEEDDDDDDDDDEDDGGGDDDDDGRYDGVYLYTANSSATDWVYPPLFTFSVLAMSGRGPAEIPTPIGISSLSMVVTRQVVPPHLHHVIRFLS
jgi:hypothetical protein